MKKQWISANFIISLVIIGGFALTTAFYYYSAQTLFRKDVEAVSRLTSENIYVSINNLMDRPLNVSITMANDTFLRNFIDKETKGAPSPEKTNTITKFLSAYQKKYDFDSVFFVSRKTGAYYHYAKGIDRYMTANNPENTWYFDFLVAPSDYALNVDNDEAKDDVVTIFVNCKLYDEGGNVLGVVGVGMETPYIQHFLSENEEKYGINAYLIDKTGSIQLSSQVTEFEGLNLFDMPIFAQLQGALVENNLKLDEKWHNGEHADGYIISKYVPNLNWYLVVEKSIVDFERQMLIQLSLAFLFVILVVLLVLWVVSAIFKRHRHELLAVAQMDQLTGIRNRASYESEMNFHRLKLGEYEQFGIGVFDLNNLKAINDQYGHQVGDAYIKEFSFLLCAAFKNCGVFRIGGDEFALTIVNVTEEDILKRLDELQIKMDTENKGLLPLSAAFGYAFYSKNSPNQIDDLFKEADKQMYHNKQESKRQ